MTSDDIGLVLEIADTLLAEDRGIMQRVYAEAGIPVYWIINIPDHQIEVYSEPQPAATPAFYRRMTLYRQDDRVPLTLDGLTVAEVLAGDLLP